MAEERFAIDYGDGSYGVLSPKETVEKAFGELDFVNAGELPTDRARLIRIHIEPGGEVSRAGITAAAAECPCCKRPLP